MKAMRLPVLLFLTFAAFSLLAQDVPEHRPLVAAPHIASMCGGLECSNTRATQSEILVPCARRDETTGEWISTTVQCSTASCVYAAPRPGADGLCQGTDCCLSREPAVSGRTVRRAATDRPGSP
jgi:hypothetical protein